MPRHLTKSRTIILLTSILFSCGDKVGGFEVPQPEGQADEKGLPKKIIGQYLNIKDSLILSVVAGQITKYLVTDLRYPKSELDSADRVLFKNDTSFTEIESNVRIDVVIKGDSVFQHVDYRDTIFSIKQGDVLKKFKGHYFLNHPISRNNWDVIKLTKTKKGLTLGTIWAKEDIEKLQELTETKSDSIYTFRPTKKQLKRFLKDEGFSNEDVYIKIK